MSISNNTRNLIADEFEYVAKKMSKAETAEETLYYFSAVHGILPRVFNSEYDPELVYMHFVLNGTYGAFMQRIQSIKSGDSVVSIQPRQTETLLKLTKELAKMFKEKTDINATMRKFAVLAYTTSGNGYYLLDKGVLKI